MFANTQMGAMSMMMPDVCKVPSPPGPPVPTPFPNNAQSSMANPATASKKVIIANAPAHNLGTTVMLSMGDNPGVLGGIISQRFMGQCKHIKGSMKVMVQGQPATRMTDQTFQNGMPGNGGPGTTIKPSQFKVLISS